MLVIDPEECIDCGLCVPECEPEAIIHDADDDGTRWQDLNIEYAAKWPVISQRGAVPADADAYAGESGKFEKYFDPQAPGVMRKSA
jgi:ferredoxin